MVYLFLVDGFEEVEALTPLDYLRRCGISVQSVGVKNKQVVGSHSIPVVADIVADQVQLDHMEMIILPGGPGTSDLEQSEIVQRAIDHCAAHNLPIGAICAAPSILGHKNLLTGKQAICFPGFEQDLTGAEIIDQPVCCDGNIITAKGAGSAQQFAFALVAYLVGQERADQLSQQVQCFQ